MKVGGIKTWKELTTGVQQLVRLLFNNNLINPGLILEGELTTGVQQLVRLLFNNNLINPGLVL